MSERQRIEERLRKKELEIQSLEEKIKAARVYVQALRDVLNIMDRDGDSAISGSVPRAGSAVAEAREVILMRRAPVHVNELLEALGREVSRESRASLTSSLAAYVRRGEIFTRPAPNTFGLIELDQETAEREWKDPPSGFGEITPTQEIRVSKKEDSDLDDIPF